MKFSSRIIHILSFFLTIILSSALLHSYPNLIKDDVTSFSTIGGIVTIYGVIFTIIEVIRARNAAVLAESESKKVYLRLTTTYDLKDITKCQIAIELALTSIEKNETIPASTLSNIVNVYSHIFHNEIENDDSPRRKNRTILCSYAFKEATNSKPSSKIKLQECLTSIAGDLSVVAGSRTSLMI